MAKRHTCSASSDLSILATLETTTTSDLFIDTDNNDGGEETLTIELEVESDETYESDVNVRQQQQRSLLSSPIFDQRGDCLSPPAIRPANRQRT